ncbi:MAG TPA: hypothetical protein P5189_03410 [Methanomassiliicoccales archaeon]|nr:hypothetical protein [Methanomassiliicoccales archaeon]
MGPPQGTMLDPGVASAAMLRPNERAVHAWRAGMERTGAVGDAAGGGSVVYGVLVATDQRLIFVQDRGTLADRYVLLESVEYGGIVDWRLSETTGVRALQVDSRDRGPWGNFVNLYEVDPMTLRGIVPGPLEQLRRSLGALKGTMP